MLRRIAKWKTYGSNKEEKREILTPLIEEDNKDINPFRRNLSLRESFDENLISEENEYIDSTPKFVIENLDSQCFKNTAKFETIHEVKES